MIDGARSDDRLDEQLRTTPLWFESRRWFVVVVALCGAGTLAFWGPFAISRLVRTFPVHVGAALLPVAVLLLPTSLAALYFRTNARRGVLPRKTRLSVRRLAWAAPLGFLVGVALELAPFGLRVLAGRDFLSEQHLVLFLEWRYVPFAVRVLGIAAAEELAFRGLLLETIERRWGSLSAVIISSVLFGAYHVFRGPSAMLAVAIAGLAYGFLAIATKSLWTSIAAHWAYNLVVLGAFGAHLLMFRRHGPPMGSFDWQEFSLIVALVLLVIAWRRGVLMPIRRRSSSPLVHTPTVKV